MSDYYEYENESQNNIFSHSGFQYGFVGGSVMIFIHIMLLLIFQGTNKGDLFAWFLAWFVYYFIGRAAAQNHYESQRESLNPTRGVQAAGTGAAMITSVLIWGYIIVRGIFRDALGVFIVVEPVGLFCTILIDILIAIGLGSWAGKSIEKKYTIDPSF